MKGAVRSLGSVFAKIDDKIASIRLPQALLITLCILALLIPFIKALASVLSGSIAFWYDPARDLFLASANLDKLTLIGPPSGIPGVFYGPYWIWLLSSGMIVSKDPRIVTLLTATLPYFIFFPLILYQFKKIYSLKIITIIWLLFIFSYDRYATQLWNPYSAPLLFLAIIYFITFTDFNERNVKRFLKIGFVGILAGLCVNFHISFGIALTGGIIFYLLLLGILTMKGKVISAPVISNYLVLLIVFGIGFSMMFVPFLAFEIRHGFMQIQTAIKTLTNEYAVVGIKGLNDFSIIEYFFGKLSDVFRIPRILVAFGGMYAFWKVLTYLRKQEYSLKKDEVRLLLLLITISTSLLGFYLSSKNPVWDYHFISVEIIFLFMIAFLMKHMKRFENIMVIITILIVAYSTISFTTNFSQNTAALNSLATKEKIVDLVMADGAQSSYTVYTYNPAIYNYDYAYLFSRRGKEVPYDPASTPIGATIVYLIIPQASERVITDYISYRTPLNEYTTVKTWKIEDGSQVIKRQKKI